MSRTSYLAKNLELLTLSAFGTKFISFFLLPFYTSILTTSDYGTFELFSTTISLCIPIFTLGISSGVMRYAMEKDIDKASVFSYGIKYFFISSIISFFLIFLNCIFSWNTVIKENSILMFLMYEVSVLTHIIPQFTRGLEDIKSIAIAGILNSFSVAVFNIIFLLLFHMGIKGYLLSYILGGLCQIIYLFFASKLWNYISLKKIDISLKKRMLSYSVPLIANDISWWINGVSDRYVVTFFCGLEANGIYSVAYKIPSVLTMFQNIFSKAWTLSVIKDFNSEDSANYFSKMYEMYNFVMIFVCSLLIVCSRFLAKILYAKDFYIAWEYVSFLLISVVFGALSGYIGAIFTAVKNTKLFAYSTVVGAVINIILNIILVHLIGVLGAAISTLICYVLIWGIRLFCVQKFVKLKIHILRDCLLYFFLIIQAVLLLVFKTERVFLYVLEFILFFLVILLNLDSIKSLFFYVKNTKSKVTERKYE